MKANAPNVRRRLLSGRRALAAAALVGPALLYASPASATGSFKAVDHDWVVALNQATLHDVPSGGTFSYCASQDVSAITPSVEYSGAPVGRSYREEVIGPTAAGSITIVATTNVDGDRVPLKFTAASGSWSNTYAVMSFPRAQHKTTLPPGGYSFEVVLAGKVIAKTTLRLATRPSC
jgi:hypothetical protein